jgi:L-ribulose-5-phosphate 3-epimerase
MNLPVSRRKFIGQSAAILAGASAAIPSISTGQPVPERKRPIRKGIMYGTVGLEGSVLEKFQAVKEAGFEGVEPNSHMDPNEVLEASQATGLKIPSVVCATHWARPLSAPNPAFRKAGLEGLLVALQDAKKYGAASVLLVPAVVNKQVGYADAYQRSQEEIRKALPLAAELQVKIAIENVWNHFLLSPLEAAQYVNEFDHDWVAWHFDVGNIINYGWPEHWIGILNKRIVQLHIKEFSREKRDNEGLWKGFDVPLLEGDNDWPGVMQALDDVGYTGWGIAEQPGGGTLEGLRDIAQRMDRIFAS